MTFKFYFLIFLLTRCKVHDLLGHRDDNNQNDRKHCFRGIIDFNSPEQTPIERTETVLRLARGSSVLDKAESLISLLSSELHPGSQENGWRSLSTDASQIQDMG